MLNTTYKYLLLLVLLSFSACAGAGNQSAETAVLSAKKLVSQATDTVQDFEARSVQHDRIVNHFRRAKAVIIIPKLHKAGFFIGGERGEALLLSRENTEWSYPSFYDISSASLGIQFGYEQSQHLLFVLSERALEKLQANNIEIGGELSVSAGTAGGSAEVATTFTGIDIVSYSLASGLYAGVSFEGSYLEFDQAYNDGYYGASNVTAEDITSGKYNNPQADALRQLLIEYAK